ncbi:MAG: hypothetical protein U0235_09585 [Polyangiaceae bacterium]
MGAVALVAMESAFRAPSDSQIRVSARSEVGIGNLADGQRALAEARRSAIAALDRRTHDPSVHAALKTIAARLDDIGDVYESLDDVVASLWLTDSPPRAGSALVRYLEGVQRWALAVTEELTELAARLFEMHADWSTFRFRLGLAKAEWPTELVADVERELASVDDDDVSDATQELSFSLHVLDANLAQRFG